jgi:hypothetical protein
MKDEIKKINPLSGDDGFLKLMDAWQVEDPEDYFFINLPVKIQESLVPVPWWRKLSLPWGAVAGSMAVLALVFGFQLGRELRLEKNLASAAAEWGIENYGWERLDEVLSLSANGQTMELPQGISEYPSISGNDYQSTTQDLSQDELKAVLEELQKRKG